MKYTIRRISAALDAALRRRAREQGKSLNEVAIDALAQGVGLVPRGEVQRDLSDVVKTWRKDTALQSALAAQDRVDVSL